MSGTRSPEHEARDSIEQAEAGVGNASESIEQARQSNPDAVDAVEQEATDGPPGRGLSR